MKFIKTVALTILAIFSICILISPSIQANDDVDYQRPSQNKPYPDPSKYHNLNILVNITKNRVYIKDANQTLYTMYCSAGMINPNTGHSYTPTSDFKLQSERGTSFYNKDLKEGANDWTSFKDHGVYLFHTVPTNYHGDYKPEEAAKLGKQPASHGCIRLSVPDAKYIQTLQTGTPVKIVEN